MNEILKKRIEEAAINGSKHYDPNISKYSQGKQVGYIRGFKEGAEYAISHQWISVEEALPENQDYVLAGYKDSIFMAWYRKRNNMWHNIYGIEMNVDRWMPIPELKTNDNG